MITGKKKLIINYVFYYDYSKNGVIDKKNQCGVMFWTLFSNPEFDRFDIQISSNITIDRYEEISKEVFDKIVKKNEI